MKKAIHLLLLFALVSCKPSATTNQAKHSSRNLNFDTFGEYWYQGLAEINTYELEQYRYGEKRNAEAVLIFVTEDFSREKQVKLDDPEQHRQDAQKVLKLNKTKKFVTGVYPYSIMLSVFTPVYDSIPAVKLTASVQEWCGQTYTQLNHKSGKYNAKLYSYFEKEADQDLNLNALAEDDIWNLIRLNPAQIPTGKLNLIPALLDQRFTHLPLQEEEANISITPATDSVSGFAAAELSVFTVTYQDYPRELHIYFTAAFPYEIAGWEEIRKLKNGEEEVTRATRKAKTMLDYWNKNKSVFEPLRQELQLKQVK